MPPKNKAMGMLPGPGVELTAKDLEPGGLIAHIGSAAIAEVTELYEKDRIVEAKIRSHPDEPAGDDAENILISFDALGTWAHFQPAEPETVEES